MMYRWTIAIVSLIVVGCVSHAKLRQGGAVAPLWDDLGTHFHEISSNSSLTQKYFNQGLILAFAFNHAEAKRSFQEAARLDPTCAICFWGIALVLGPNINAAMDPKDHPEAYKAVREALRLLEGASLREQEYIRAISHRYASEAMDDRRPLDQAYAQAMRELVMSDPDDLDASVLLAEALMDLTPWNYWTKEGEPHPWTPEILTLLESVLERAPNHPGANHLYIHAVEASSDPGRAIPSADRLRDLVPGAGHLVHMPSHIYMRVGMYHEVSLANERALLADEAYFRHDHAEGLYPMAYHPHNLHFLWAAATMEGRSELALHAARTLSEKIDPKQMREPGLGTLQHFYVMPLFAQIRFGRWDDLLSAPMPAQDLLYPQGVWHHARAMAYIRMGKTQEAEGELGRLRQISSDPALELVTIWDINTTKTLLAIATEVTSGELASQQGNHQKAILHLQTAVQLEDQLNYDEPSPWYSPVRQSLGAVLLKAERAKEAEAVYREDLRRLPENGWSLFGLRESLVLQGKDDAAREVQKQFTKAWMRADVTLTASRF